MRKLDILSFLTATFFVAAGISHFTEEEFFLKMMPDYLPWHLFLVHLSGVCEILCGLGLMWRKSRSLASYGTIALLVAVFPANINMLQNAHKFPEISESFLWIRLPIQVLAIYWIYLLGKWQRNQLTSLLKSR